MLEVNRKKCLVKVIYPVALTGDPTGVFNDVGGSPISPFSDFDYQVEEEGTTVNYVCKYYLVNRGGYVNMGYDDFVNIGWKIQTSNFNFGDVSERPIYIQEDIAILLFPRAEESKAKMLAKRAKEIEEEKVDK